MKLVLMSDLHFEFHRDGGAAFCEEILDKTPTCDVIALAGDIGQLNMSYWQIKDFLTKLSRKAETVIYVPGNHEGYRSSYEESTKLLIQLQEELPWEVGVASDCIYEVQYNDFDIYAGTLWFPNLMPDAYLKSCMADFSYVKSLEQHIYRENDAFIKLLKEHWDNTKKNIIITHHMPSYQCVEPKFRGNALNQFFCNDLDDLITELKPRVWICGHSHEAIDIKIGDTRVVSSPSGYPNEIPKDWAPKVIEV
jgi:predicted phosphodiesterase